MMQKAVEGFEAWSAGGESHLILRGIVVCDEILAEISVSILPKKKIQNIIHLDHTYTSPPFLYIMSRCIIKNIFGTVGVTDPERTVSLWDNM